MTALEQHIKSVFGIDNNHLTMVADMFNEQQLTKGDFYLRTSHVCDKLSFIKSGLIRIFVSTEHQEVTQWISTPGYFVTDLASFVFQQPARWTIQALTDCSLYTIPKSNYDKLNQTIPEWNKIEKLFIAKCFVLLEDRIFTHLSMSAEQRYEHFFAQNKDLFNHVPLQYIASMLGMTPETMSRIRKRTS